MATNREIYVKDGDVYTQIFSTKQAAAQIGITRPGLIKLISVNDGLRPSLKIGADFFWTAGEIANARAKRKGTVGRPSK